MNSPPKWTRAQLDADAAEAVNAFRFERLDESLELYSEHFTAFTGIFAALVDRLPELKSAALDADMIADFMAVEDTRRAFCYLTAPPISEDDLKTLAEARLTPKALRANPDMAHRVRDIVCRLLDVQRFPWIAENRDPLPEERAAAIVASSALVAARKVEMFRRTDAKERQEGRVKELLRSVGFEEIDRRPIPNGAAAPKPGEFMGETPLAGKKADVVATLHDGRILAIECKVSNSAVNSYKRLIHDTGGKATNWYRELGRANVIAAAVLNGVFNPANCEDAQNAMDVAIFWGHRLNDLWTFVDEAK